MDVSLDSEASRPDIQSGRLTPNLGVHTLAPPDRPVPPMAGTAAIGAVVHLPATVIKEGRDLSSSMSGLLADTV